MKYLGILPIDDPFYGYLCYDIRTVFIVIGTRLPAQL